MADPGSRRVEAALIAGVVVIVTLLGWRSIGTTDGSPPSQPVPMVAEAPATIGVTVHVAGAVRRPGVFHLPPGARVVDAIEAAGGVTERAVLTAVNLAAELVDGHQIVVPEAVDGGGGSVPAPGDGLVVVNHASAADLEALPGVGPVLAGRIIAHRDQHGPFQTPEDLLDVSGIGESILARLRPLIRIP